MPESFSVWERGTPDVTWEERRNLPAGMYLLWCTWHLQWQRGKRSEADLQFGSNPYDSVASLAERHEYEPKTGLYEETSKM